MLRDVIDRWTAQAILAGHCLRQVESAYHEKTCHGPGCQTSGSTKTPQQNEDLVRDIFLHRRFCTSETRIRGQILGNKFWMPEFWTRILGSNFLILLFQQRRPPEKFTLKKFTSQNSPSKLNPEIGKKIFTSHLCSQGHLADICSRLVSHYSAIGDTISCDAPYRLHRQASAAIPI